MRALTLLAVVVFVGCPPVDGAVDGGPEPLWRGGSRLKLRWQVAEGGARVYASLFDGELGVPCTPARGVDAGWRCVPSEGEAWRVFFSDNACTVPVLSSTECGGPLPRFPSELWNDGCSLRGQAYEVTGDAPAGSLTGHIGAGCGSYTPSFTPTLKALAPLDDARLATLLEHDVRVGALVAQVGTSADGASVVLGLRSAATDEPCSLEPVDAATTEAATRFTCMPPLASERRDWFSDASCTTRVAIQVLSACGATPQARAAWLSVPSPDGCSSALIELHALGPALSEVYERSVSCGAVPAGSAYQRVFAVGAVLDLSTLPVVEHEDQGAAVKARALSVAGRLVGPATHFSLGGARCELLQFPDGSTRCASLKRDLQVTAQGVAYADAACTQPLYPSPWDTACNGATPEHILLVEGDRCGTRVLSVLGVGARYTGTSLYWKGGGPAPCNPLPNLGTVYYEAAGSMSPEVFERITELVE